MFGGTILSETYTWSDLWFGQQVRIQVDVLDNFRGDYSRAEWRYTVHNVNFIATPTLGCCIDYSQSLLTVFYLPFKLPVEFRRSAQDLFSSFYGPDGWTKVYNYGPDWDLIDGDNYLKTGHNEGVAWITGEPYPCSPPCGVTPQIGIPPGSSAAFGFAMTKPVMIGESSLGESPAALLMTMAFDAPGKYGPEAGLIGGVLVPGVPEPMTAVLVGAGLIALALLHRRRHWA
jgi:hypothetical protein